MRRLKPPKTTTNHCAHNSCFQCNVFFFGLKFKFFNSRSLFTLRLQMSFGVLAFILNQFCLCFCGVYFSFLFGEAFVCIGLVFMRFFVCDLWAASVSTEHSKRDEKMKEKCCNCIACLMLASASKPNCIFHFNATNQLYHVLYIVQSNGIFSLSLYSASPLALPHIPISRRLHAPIFVNKSKRGAYAPQTED